MVHFEYLVMPFGLANAPATFQAYINQALAGYIDVFCIVYLDDILIYSDSEEEHWEHIEKVLERLRQFKLYAKLSKCQFAVKTVEFLGFVLSPNGVAMEKSRVETIKDWPKPRTFRELQVFLGFTNFYRRFIRHYSKIASSLTDLLKGSKSGRKLGPFVFGADAETAFEQLKKAFMQAPLLRHFDPKKPIRLETDASGFAIAGILSQPWEVWDSGRKQIQWHPVAFWSRKMIPAERNYETHDAELLAIVMCFKQWRHYLEGSQFTVTVLSDHNNLKYFQTTKELTQCVQ